MDFQPIELQRGSDVTFALKRWSRDVRPFISIIHLAFAGRYRPGSAGAPDAHYMKGIWSIVEGAWWPSAMVLDFSELSYVWGDEMDLLLPEEGEHDIAVVVSDKCSRAMSTLHFGVNSPRRVTELANYFDSLPAAIRHLAEHQVANWNAHVKTSGHLNESDLLALGDLGFAE